MPELPDLPVRAVLGDVRDALDARGAAVLVAPPGTGKTTLVPLALSRNDSGRVLVAEPRRVAARAAAARMAALLGSTVGDAVGYSVRGDSRTSAATRVEVVTSGLLLRRLTADPELPGTHTVVLDEVHERHLDADLLLSLLLDARDGLRPDLRLLAASATVDADRPARLLGGDVPAPVVAASARTHPVAVHHVPPGRGETVEAAVARAVRIARRHGSVLAFLPGVAEIDRVAGALRADPGLDADVLVLHGRLGAAEQDAALRDRPRPRVVLATAVAESSLTVPGVRAVVDSGLVRVPHTDHRRGLSGLVTRRVSRAVAEQRAGRAGREAPGHVYRCWPEGDVLVRAPEPEIRTADLTRLALDLAAWGTPTGEGLRWWDAPPPGPLDAGRRMLAALGALDGDGALTPRGSRMAALGLHPRLARALLDGAADAGADVAAQVVALLDDDAPAGPDTDLDAALARLRSGNAPGSGRWRAEVRRLTALARRSAAPPRPGGMPAAPHPADTKAPSARPGDTKAPFPRPGDTEAPFARPGETDAPVARPGDTKAPSAHPGDTKAPSAHPGEAEAPVAHPGDTEAPFARPGDTEAPFARPGDTKAPSAQPGDTEAPFAQPGDTEAPFARAGDAALVVGYAYPERVARRREPGSGAFLMASGTAVQVPDGPLRDREWLAVAVADRRPGDPHGRVRLAATADRELAERVGAALLSDAVEVGWSATEPGGTADVRAVRVRRLGAIVLDERPVADPDPAAVRDALVEGVRTEGTGLLRWGAAARSLAERLGFLHRVLGDPWPAVDEQSLRDGATEPDGWLAVPLATARRRADLARIDAGTALRGHVASRVGAAIGRLDELAPERVTVPSGSRIALDYSGEAPALPVRVQEVFGWTASPAVAGGRVPVVLHLLSPAGRPTAVTGDLESFWDNGYPQVRAELRGRYPKHAWPEDPRAAVPARGTGRRRG